MKPMSFPVPAIAATLLMVTLAGCATDQPQQHNKHHPGVAAAPAPAMQGHKAPDGGMPMSKDDMTAMCAGMHEKMMSAKTPEERKAVMQAHMKSMSPEMRQRMHEHMMSLSPEKRQQMHEQMGAMSCK